MKPHLTILVILLTGIQSLTAQIDSSVIWQRASYDTSINFYELRDIQEQYYNDHPDPDAGESSDRAEFYRWADFWEYRVSSIEGNNGSIHDAMKKYFEAYSHVDEYFNEAENPIEDWKYLGPKHFNKQAYGIIQSVVFDPADNTHKTIYAGSGSAGLWKTTDGGTSWRNITGNYLPQGLGIMDILINSNDNQIIYLALGFSSMGRKYSYGSGIMKTTDGGDTWVTLSMNPAIQPTDLRPITKLIADPSDPLRILAFGRRYIYRTTDGVSFEKISDQIFPAEFMNNCGQNDQIKIVTDAVITQNDPNTVYISTDGYEYGNPPQPCSAEIWRISNIFSNVQQSDFTRIDNISDVSFRFMLDYEPSLYNDKVFFGGAFDLSAGTRFRLYNFDINTQIVTQLCSNKFIIGLSRWMFQFEMSSQTPGAFVVCGYYLDYYTNYNTLSDEVQDNNYQYYHTDTRALQFISDGVKEYLLIGNDGGVTLGSKTISSSDFSFININGHGLYITQFYGLGVSSSNPNYFAGGAQDNEMLHFNYENTNQWGILSEGVGDAYDVLINPQDQDFAFFYTGSGGPSVLRMTKDGFASNEGVQVNISGNDNGSGSNKPLAIDPVNNNIVYMGHQNIYKSIDWGNTSFDLFFDRSSLQSSGLIQSRPLSDIEITPSDNKIIYASFLNTEWEDLSSLIKTTSANEASPTWTILDPDGSNIQECSFRLGITDIEVATIDPDWIWVSFGKFERPADAPARIMESKNGGTSFRIISDLVSLPNVPFNCLKAVKKQVGGYLLFAGTDFGIYVWDTDTELWEPFNYHLPPCIISDIELIQDENENKSLRISTFGRGIWETPLDCGKSNNYQVLSQNETWSTDQIIHNNVYIPSGIDLTITAKISFVGGTGLIVQPGGQLHVNGGTLTSACGTMWNGITVYGDPHQPISNQSYHGYAYFDNAIIENAITGVRTLGGDPEREISSVNDIEETFPAGGFIMATNTIFKNNYIGTLINPYSERKNDLFRECTFEWSSELLPPYLTPHSLVKLNDVNYIRFLGCTFKTDDTFSQYQADGIGILAINSTFFVDAQCLAYGQYDCVEWKYSEFYNLDYGIKALAFSPTRTFRVDQANFERINTGIYASGVSTAQVSRSNFTLLKVDTIYREHFGGLYLDFCNGYMVEDNIFSGPGDFDDTWAIGLLINNSNYGSYQNSDNEIYNNEFNTLDIGILPQNKNRNSVFGDYGLTLKCNNFNECNYDIAVTVYPQNDPTLGIKDPQGVGGTTNPNDPAGNIFSDAGMGFHWDDYNYHNEGGQLAYYHHDQSYSSEKVEPTDYSNINPFIGFIGIGYDPLECCLSNFTPVGGGGGGGIEDQKALLGGFESKADSVNELLVLLVDGGNTQQTNQDVVFSMPPEALEVYNDLISKSPYLSDEVMISAVKQELVLDPVMVTDILTENPQAAKSDTVVYELENRITPLSDDQMTEVMQGLYTTGAKEALESNLAGYRNDYTKTLNNIVRYYNGDTLSISPVDSIISWLSLSDYLWARYHQAFSLSEDGDTSGSSALLGNLSNSFSFTPEMYTELENYSELLDYFGHCRDSLLSILQNDSIWVSELFSIMHDSSGLTSIYATNLLSTIGKVNYSERYILPVPGLKDSKAQWPKLTTRERNSLKIYPNPAYTYCIVEFELKDFQNVSTLKISDSQGKPILLQALTKTHDYLVISLENFPSGLYICTVDNGGKTLKSAKLIVNK